MANCNIERTFEIKHGTLNITDGAYAEDRVEVVTRECGDPLFSDRERKLGACRSCLNGFIHDKNFPTERGLQQIIDLLASEH